MPTGKHKQKKEHHTATNDMAGSLIHKHTRTHTARELKILGEKVGGNETLCLSTFNPKQGQSKLVKCERMNE